MALSKEQSRSLCSLIPSYCSWNSNPFRALTLGRVDCLGFSLIACALDFDSRLIGLTEDPRPGVLDHTNLHFAAVSRLSRQGVQTLEMGCNGPRIRNYGKITLARHRYLAGHIIRGTTTGLEKVAKSTSEESTYYRRLSSFFEPAAGIRIESIGRKGADEMLDNVSPDRTMAELRLAVNRHMEWIS